MAEVGRARAGSAAVVCTILASASGCVPGDVDRGPTVTVLAASSLRGAFADLADRFERRTGAEVVLGVAGSSDLAAQIVEGAPADVFASADLATMTRVASAGLLEGSPRSFATNSLTIAVPAGNPAAVRSLADLAGAGMRVVLCAPQVPCGAAAARLQAAAGVSLTPVSEEGSVADVLNKVAAGEADAGLVYVTDVALAVGAVDEVPIRESAAPATTYAIGVLRGARDRDAAREFADLVAGPDGRAVLAAAGFGPAP